MTNDAVPVDIEAPPLRELGLDLLRVSPRQRLVSLSLPFFWCACYFGLAALGWWPLAVLALVALSFVTYGSTSHDLVHRNLGLSRTANDILLCLFELLGLRSGHAYQVVHLHHHARFPHRDDIEAAAARRSCFVIAFMGMVPRLLGHALRDPAALLHIVLAMMRRTVIPDGGGQFEMFVSIVQN